MRKSAKVMFTVIFKEANITMILSDIYLKECLLAKQ
jgi:hypothetical protein